MSFPPSRSQQPDVQDVVAGLTGLCAILFPPARDQQFDIANLGEIFANLTLISKGIATVSRCVAHMAEPNTAHKKTARDRETQLVGWQTALVTADLDEIFANLTLINKGIATVSKCVAHMANLNMAHERTARDREAQLVKWQAVFTGEFARLQRENARLQCENARLQRENAWLHDQQGANA